jgi:hypothetical protein
MFPKDKWYNATFEGSQDQHVGCHLPQKKSNLYTSRYVASVIEFEAP